MHVGVVRVEQTSMGRRTTISQARELFLEVGYTPRFTTFVNVDTPVDFTCDRGHHYKITLARIKAGGRCGLCSKSKKFTVEKARQAFLDVGYAPGFTEYTNAHKPLPFVCDNGHHHKISLGGLNHGQRCSKCVGGVRFTLEEARDNFRRVGYVPLFSIYKNVAEQLAFTCDKGHAGTIRLSQLRAGVRCATCAGNTRLSFSEVTAVFEEAGYVPTFKEYLNAITPLTVRCTKGHATSISVNNFKKGHRCSRCSRRTSKPQKELADYFSSRGCNVVFDTRRMIPPYELDLYFPDRKVAVEYCGLYWHSEISGGKERTYHFSKRSACEARGIRLITVFEDEFHCRPEVVLSRIEAALNIVSTRLYARKCTVRQIENRMAREFLDKHHLQGGSACRVSFGLFSEDKLVGVMTGGLLTRKHTSTARTLEMKRFCFYPGLVVVGGASKLFKRLLGYAVDNEFTEIRSYQDMRYGDPFNPIYSVLGFTLVAETKYTPHYVKRGRRWRNYSMRKTPEERLTGKTEWELRQEQGYDRIWDCGHRTYAYFPATKGHISK